MTKSRMSIKYVVAVGVLGALSLASLAFAGKPPKPNQACYDICCVDRKGKALLACQCGCNWKGGEAAGCPSCS
jgi:hypothetical protein